MARLLAKVANTVTTMLLPAATAATSTTTLWALRAGAIHRPQVHGHMLASATAVGTHTARCLPSSASHTLSHQSCMFKVLWIRHQDLAAYISCQTCQEAFQHFRVCNIADVQQRPPE